MSKLRKSFKHAIDGLYYVARHERNFQIEMVIGIFIGVLILILKLKGWEAIVLILMIMWVMVTELTNTVFEKVVDILKPRIHPYARVIKDIMAAVVLISCIVAVMVGIIIFLPYIREFLRGY
jgi:diacylglycerol kinase